MKIEVLGAYGGVGPGMRPTSLLIEDRVVLDAGSIARSIDFDRQQRIEAVVLTHAHADHICELPFFLENIASALRPPVRIYGSVATLYAVRRHLINNHIWPDLDASTIRPRMMEFVEIETEQPFVAGGVQWTPFAVDHTVPTFGYVLEDSTSSILWSSDTGPTHRLWEIINSKPELNTAMVEVSFDNARQELADRTGHLTPSSLKKELGKCTRELRVLVHHLKPVFVERLGHELADFEILEQGRVYEF